MLMLTLTYWCGGVQGDVDRKEEALQEPHLVGFHVQDKHLRDGILGQRGLVSVLISIRQAVIQTHGCQDSAAVCDAVCLRARTPPAYRSSSERVFC